MFCVKLHHNICKRPFTFTDFFLPAKILKYMYIRIQWFTTGICSQGHFLLFFITAIISSILNRWLDLSGPYLVSGFNLQTMLVLSCSLTNDFFFLNEMLQDLAHSHFWFGFRLEPGFKVKSDIFTWLRQGFQKKYGKLSTFCG